MAILRTDSVPNVTEAPEGMWPNTALFDERVNQAEAEGLPPCQICGKASKTGWTIMVVDGGVSILAVDQWDEVDTSDPGYMGSWVLGTSCSKAIPSEYRQRMVL